MNKRKRLVKNDQKYHAKERDTRINTARKAKQAHITGEVYNFLGVAPQNCDAYVTHCATA